MPANRTRRGLAGRALDRRPQFALRPGAALPGGTAPGFDAPAKQRAIFQAPPKPVPAADEVPLKINMDQERPVRKPVKPVVQQDVLPLPQSEMILPPRGALAGPPSAIVAAEGVLPADPPAVPQTLPSRDLREAGSAARSGKDEVLRNTR